MNPFSPIYTETTECQDCYKCVRSCPVKAIHVKDGKASVIDERCVMCGNCVRVCPVGAKRIRDDIARAKRLIKLKKDVLVSLAPSYICEFPGVQPQQMIRALKMLGFAKISETALGAQEVSAHLAEELKNSQVPFRISSACPTVVNIVNKYYPQYHTYLSDMYSPVMAHCTYLKKTYGEENGIVFIGPCAAKKWESDTHEELLNIALTFQNLRSWFKEKQIDPLELPITQDDIFLPEAAQEGALYPIEGGMITGMKSDCGVNDSQYMTFSGMKDVLDILDNLDSVVSDKPVFLELLSCEGGCINGPACSTDDHSLQKRLAVLKNAKEFADNGPRKPSIQIDDTVHLVPLPKPEHNEKDIIKSLHSVGKYKPQDELNCSGCGYDTCRDFAIALLDGKAERSMCVSYMRQLAGKKANALINTMPSGVVIVNDNLKIIECNRNFVSLLGEEAEIMYDAKPGLSNALLEKTIDFSSYFSHVLKTGKDLLDEKIKQGDTILSGSIFTIEKHRIVGGLFQNITQTTLDKQNIITKTKEVIENNLSTVQKIAYLLGENASETEIILDSIITSFSIDEDKKKS